MDKRDSDGRISVEEYVSFWTTSCIRSDFTLQYFALGMAEESAELLEESDRKRKIKECGDVLWYVHGMILRNGMKLEDILGKDWSGLRKCEDKDEKVGALSDETKLVLAVGRVAGRVKKFDRGDYDVKKLREYLRPLLLATCQHLHDISSQCGADLETVAFLNREKIMRRLKANTIRGDGSDR